MNSKRKKGPQNSHLRFILSIVIPIVITVAIGFAGSVIGSAGLTYLFFYKPLREDMKEMKKDLKAIKDSYESLVLLEGLTPEMLKPIATLMDTSKSPNLIEIQKTWQELHEMVSKMYKDPWGYTWGDLDCSDFEERLGEETKAQLEELIREDFYGKDKTTRQIQLHAIIYLNENRPGLKDTFDFECPRWRGCIAQHVESKVQHLMGLESKKPKAD